MNSNFRHVHSNMSGLFSIIPFGSAYIHINESVFTDILSLGSGSIVEIIPNSDFLIVNI